MAEACGLEEEVSIDSDDEEDPLQSLFNLDARGHLMPKDLARAKHTARPDQNACDEARMIVPLREAPPINPPFTIYQTS